MNQSSAQVGRAVIVCPPWPRGGTARVIQNQVEFYRSRGYATAVICVPLHCAFVDSHSGWKDLRREIEEFGADRALVAPIQNLQFQISKYRNWIRHKFQGTALDWIVFTAGAARLSSADLRLLQQQPTSVVHVNHVFTLEFGMRLARLLAAPGQQVPMILETHDVQAQALRDRGEVNPWTHRPDRLEQLIQSELAHLRNINVFIHCSVDDLEYFKRHLPQQKHVLAMPTINEAFVSDAQASNPSSLEPIDLLFVGQSTDANRDAMRWFFDEVWPLIAERGYRVKVVGQIAQKMQMELPRIYRRFQPCFTGSVSELAPFYQAARCVFAPMVSGTGVSVKTIEALALGKPFVGTSKAFRGMPMGQILQSGLQPHDTPPAFADAIVHALTDGRTLSETGRAVYESLFSRQAAFSARDEALRLAGIL